MSGAGKVTAPRVGSHLAAKSASADGGGPSSPSGTRCRDFKTAVRHRACTLYVFLNLLNHTRRVTRRGHLDIGRGRGVQRSDKATNARRRRADAALCCACAVARAQSQNVRAGNNDDKKDSTDHTARVVRKRQTRNTTDAECPFRPPRAARRRSCRRTGRATAAPCASTRSPRRRALRGAKARGWAQSQVSSHSDFARDTRARNRTPRSKRHTGRRLASPAGQGKVLGDQEVPLCVIGRRYVLQREIFWKSTPRKKGMNMPHTLWILLTAARALQFEPLPFGGGQPPPADLVRPAALSRFITQRAIQSPKIQRTLLHTRVCVCVRVCACVFMMCAVCMVCAQATAVLLRDESRRDDGRLSRRVSATARWPGRDGLAHVLTAERRLPRLRRAADCELARLPVRNARVSRQLSRRYERVKKTLRGNQEVARRATYRDARPANARGLFPTRPVSIVSHSEKKKNCVRVLRTSK